MTYPKRNKHNAQRWAFVLHSLVTSDLIDWWQPGQITLAGSGPILGNWRPGPENLNKITFFKVS